MSNPLLLSSLAGAIASVALTLIIQLITRKRKAHLATRHTSERKLLEFALNENDFHSYPPKVGRQKSHYFWRSKEPEERNPIFYYFLKPEIKLQSFKAFLVPLLDRGRVDKSVDHLKIPPELDPTWKKYFDEVGKKALEAKRLIAGERGIAVRFINPIARRIIFLDKFLIDLLIADVEDVTKIIHSSSAKQDGDASIRNFLHLAIRVASDTLMLHDMSRRWEDSVRCLYLDKSEIRGDQYYDFGLYEFDNDGSKAVYLPAFRKDIYKTVTEDRLYFDHLEGQKLHIIGFESDFDQLWDYCSVEAAALDREIEGKTVVPGDKKYRKKTCFSLQAFHQGYYQSIKDALATIGIELETTY